MAFSYCPGHCQHLQLDGCVAALCVGEEPRSYLDHTPIAIHFLSELKTEPILTAGIGMSRIMYELEVCSDGTTEAQPRLFRQNRPTASTLSDIMQVQVTTHVTKNTRECRNVSVFGKTLGVHGCTLTHEVLQHEQKNRRSDKNILLCLSPNMCDLQSGFRRKDGTAHQLTRLVHEWSQALDKDQYVGTVFFDLKKAFDKVWHKGLLIKLEFAGIIQRALSWIRNYLSVRYQCVKINNSTSTPGRIHAGVPQGAILSPLL